MSLSKIRFRQIGRNARRRLVALDCRQVLLFAEVRIAKTNELAGPGLELGTGILRHTLAGALTPAGPGGCTACGTGTTGSRLGSQPTAAG